MSETETAEKIEELKRLEPAMRHIWVEVAGKPVRLYDALMSAVTAQEASP